jgi:hypothetical protein
MTKQSERNYEERLRAFKPLVPLAKTISDRRLLHDVLTTQAITFDRFTAGAALDTYDLHKLAALHVARTINRR